MRKSSSLRFHQYLSGRLTISLGLRLRAARNSSSPSRRPSSKAPMVRKCAKQAGASCWIDWHRSWRTSGHADGSHQPGIPRAERCDSPGDAREAQRGAHLGLRAGEASGRLPGGCRPTLGSIAWATCWPRRRYPTPILRMFPEACNSLVTEALATRAAPRRCGFDSDSNGSGVSFKVIALTPHPAPMIW
jgi:hypothetical protein